MGGCQRETGIDIIGKVRWGTHMAQLYSNKSDIFEIVVPYFKTGLKNNEQCVYIYSQDSSYEEVETILRNSIENVNKYIEMGQLLLIPYTEWYLLDGIFDEVRVNRQWLELSEGSISKGFDGLRAVGGTYWVEKKYNKAFFNYEFNIGAFIKNLPIVVLCLYDTNKVDTLETAKIIRSHTYTLTKHDNQYEMIKNMELILMDKQLANREHLYKRVIQLLPDIVFIHDEYNIYYCNKAAFYLTGISVEDLPCDKSVLDFVITRQKNKFRKHIKNVLNINRESHFIEVQFICSDGNIKVMEIVSSKNLYNGKPALISVFRDKTECKRIDELEKDVKKNKELLNNVIEHEKIKTEYFSNFSHELRTPINVILGAIQLFELDEEFLQEKYNSYLKSMKQNCLRLIRLVNNIIDINKLDANVYEINKKNYDIVSLVEEITLSVVDYAKNKYITIAFDTNVEEKVIACDQDKIERIILNLISNAIKFTHNGGHILVSVIDCDDTVKIIVKDNGIGIPTEKHQSIFNRYEQVDKSLRRECEGSGIGLSIVKALVEIHGGSIILNSELGKGSEFIVELPSETLISNSNLISDGLYYKHNHKHFVERINVEFSDIYS
ncbi:MEDS domain-containing protein [Tissierella sp. Yu-01]|uniref:MEDS domain-containing protein n=1 Tax=Tissierella sp. Yu-01 TaxID=3035694 RepID=UPI00240CF9FC|nr:MEDS domain-containing protein [Tissierella sp. Yu-01]WFA07990.1 MEDS domain-containing protein [Tissierella sp. Yu-01]